MKKLIILFVLGAWLIMPAKASHAAVTAFNDETAFLNAVSNPISETFEGTAWDTVRSNASTVNAAVSITSLGVSWTSNDRVTTSTSAGRSGYGIYPYKHGIPDSLTGTSSQPLYAVGGWFTTNTPVAKINLILDDTTTVDFNDTPVGNRFIFLGAVSTVAFTKFEFREMEGAVGDQKFIFADDFHVATQGGGDIPATANAGDNQAVFEGETVTLSGSGTGSNGSDVVSFKWVQMGGLTAPLSNPDAATTTFVAPPVPDAGSDLVFRLTITDADSAQAQAEVMVLINDNGISLYPVDVYTFYTGGNDPLGIRILSGGQLISLSPVDPPVTVVPVAVPADPPDQVPYGLIDLGIDADSTGGTVEVGIYLPQAPAADALWYLYDAAAGWSDFTSSVQFGTANGDALLTIVDGGNGDMDGSADGRISLLSGLVKVADTSNAGDSPPDTGTEPGGGTTPPSDGSGGGGVKSGESGSGGGGGCFVSTLAR